FILFILVRRAPSSTLFPYTTLFRSGPRLAESEVAAARQAAVDVAAEQHQRHFGVVRRPVGDDAAPVVGRVVVDDHDLERHTLGGDRKSTRLNSSHVKISYAVFCLKK